MRILVAYATRYGSTREIAERIGHTLEEEGLTTEVVAVDDANDLYRYDAFVIGSAVFASHWMRRATNFVRTHSHVLSESPVWLFSVGPLGDSPAKTPEPREYEELNTSTRAAGHAIFYGALDVTKLRGLDRVIGPALKSYNGDYRDWQAIEAWASGIAEELRAQTPAATATAAS